VRLVGTRIDADGARVDVVISEYTGPFDGQSEFPTTFVLARSDGAWLIVDEPWPIYHCEGEADL
jgi:hypothetical protein